MRKLRVGIGQIITRLGDIKGNRERILKFIDRGKQKDVDVIVFPELSTLGFGSGDIYLDKVNENLELVNELVDISRNIKPYLIVGFVDRDERGFFYNAAAIIGNGKILGIHRKVQLVNYRLFDEKRYFAPGTSVNVFDTPWGKTGILICEDVWFPEPARILAFKGAEIIFVLSASPFDRGKPEVWRAFLTSRIYDNILPMVMVNQAGIQDGVTYWGGSMVFDAAGNLTNKARLLEEEFMVAEVNLDLSKVLRRRDIRLRETRLEILQELLNAYKEMQK